jgi:hypothetical protein
MKEEILQYTATGYNDKLAAEKEFDILMFYYKINKYCYRKYDDGRSADEKHPFINADEITQRFERYPMAQVMETWFYIRDEYQNYSNSFVHYFDEDFKNDPDEFVQKSRALLNSGFLHNEVTKKEDKRLLLNITSKGEEYIEESIQYNITKIKREEKIQPLNFTYMKNETYQNSPNQSTNIQGDNNKVNSHNKTSYYFIAVLVIIVVLGLFFIF